jgi:transposase
MLLLKQEDQPGDNGTVRRRRRVWSEAEKRRIVAESRAPGASVSVIARRYDLNANMLFTWRRLFRESEAGVAFAPALITVEDPGSARSAAAGEEPRRAEGDSARSAGRMEIVLASGRRVIVDKEVDAPALARVIGILERR